jgi:hypothetical protein
MAAEHDNERIASAGITMFAALLAIGILAVASWVSWVGVGTACVSTTFSAGSPAAGVCEVELANWHGKGSSTSADNLHDYFVLALPVLILIGGVALSRYRRHRRPFWLALSAAIIVLLLPLLGLILLPRS